MQSKQRLPITKGSSPVCYPTSPKPSPFSYRGSPVWPNEWGQTYNESEGSDFLSQSVASSTSWSDEFEGDLTKSLEHQLHVVENTLYNDGGQQLPNHSPLREECRLWQLNFPHIRILGQAIKSSVGCQTRSRHEEIEEQIEEIIASHGDHDEKCVNKSLVKKDILTDSNEVYKEKIKKAVLEQIFARVWPHVVKKIEPLLKKAAAKRGNVVSVSPELKLNCGDNFSGELTSGFNSLTIGEDLSLKIKSGRRSGVSAHRNVSAMVPVKPIVIECSIPVPNLAIRSSSALKRSPGSLSQALKYPSPERLLSPLPPSATEPTRSAGRRVRAPERRPDSRPRPQYDAKTGRMIKRDDSRSGLRRKLKTSPPVPWSRHITLPPIETTEILPKYVESKSKRSTSALFKGGRLNSGSRPNTCLTSKNQVVLSPLDSLQIRQTAIAAQQPWPSQHNYSNCEALQMKSLEQRHRWRNRSNVIKR